MKSLLRTIALVTAFASASLAHASQIFDYSYSFFDSNNSVAYLVNGSFTGTASGGNLITNLSGISASVNNVAFNGPLFGNSYLNGIGYLSGGAVASFDGTENNLFFVDCDFSTASPCSPTNYLLITDWTGDGFTDHAWVYSDTQIGSVFPDAEDYGAARWSVAARGAVPEPESLALVAIALLGLAVTRRRHQA